MARKRVSHATKRRVVTKRVVITPFRQLLIIIGIILFLSLLSWVVYAANNPAVLGAKTKRADAGPFSVKKVTIVGSNGKGACKSSKNIKGHIQVNSAGTLTYQWVLNGVVQPIQTVTVNHPGTINVNLFPKKGVQATPAVSPTLTSGTVMLGTLTPNVVSAQKDLTTLCTGNGKGHGKGKGKGKENGKGRGNGLDGILNAVGLGHGNNGNGQGKGHDN